LSGDEILVDCAEFLTICGVDPMKERVADEELEHL